MRPAALACVLLLSLVASAVAATPAVRVAMTTSTTKPLVDSPWRYTITAKRSGKPVVAKARLQILLGSTVVGCWKRTAMVPCQGATSGTWIRFKGRRTGTLTWPAQSIGVRLTFQATVVAGGRVLRLRAPVTVQPV
jgi:hypothetical protein